MADSRAAGIFAALRVAAESPAAPFLLRVSDPEERARLRRALGGESQDPQAQPVRECDSVAEALRLASEKRFEMIALDPDRESLDVDLFTAAEEFGFAEDLVLLCDRDVTRIAEAFQRGVPAVLPRPLPENDALLRAHLRWLTSSHRARVRGQVAAAAFARYRAELEGFEPALATALANLVVEADVAKTPIRVAALGSAEGVRLVHTTPLRAGEGADVVVIVVEATDRIEARLAQGRAQAAGAGTILVDGGATPERASAAIYGGARAYLPSGLTTGLDAVVAAVARRRRLEVLGRKLVEVLARFGVFDDRSASPAPSRDLDSRLIAGMSGKGDAFVPSGHEVLVVDDEIVVLTVLREALRRGGYRVTTAGSAEEAIELLKQRSFDLVLTDKNLTGASGIEVLRFARTLPSAPAVVLITGYSSYDSAVEALDIGALDYIEKPIRDVELLRQRIRRALSRRDEQMSRAPAAAEATPHKARILLVEVEEDKRKLLTEFLRRSYEVVPVANGDEALDRIKQERFEVVLADRNLPGMSGLRVIEQAQRLLPHCASVLYTAYPSFESVKDAFDVGADAYLVRPSEDLKALEEKVAGALRGKGGIMLG